MLGVDVDRLIFILKVGESLLDFHLVIWFSFLNTVSTNLKLSLINLKLTLNNQFNGRFPFHSTSS